MSIIDTTKVFDCPHKLKWMDSIVKVNSAFCRECQYKNRNYHKEAGCQYIDCQYEKIWSQFKHKENKNKKKLRNIKLDADVRFMPGRGKVVLLQLSEFNFLLKMSQIAIKNEQNKEEK